MLVSTNHISGAADRLRRCQLSSPVSVINIWWSAAMLITSTVEICIQQLGRIEEMIWLPYDAGLSTAAPTLVGILKRVIVSSAIYPRFYPSSCGLSPIAELLVNFWHSGTLMLSLERQSAQMSEIENGRLGCYGTEHSKCNHLMILREVCCRPCRTGHESLRPEGQRSGYEASQQCFYTK